MRRHRIAAIPGDGIGREVTPAALEVLEGDSLRTTDAILLGAIGRPDLPDPVSLWGLPIPIRRRFAST